MRRAIDLLFGISLYREFCACRCIEDVATVVWRMTDFERIGVVTATMLLLISVIEIIAKLLNRR